MGGFIMEANKTTCVERVMSKSTGLKRSMKMKAAVMTGVGGTIGTGLFLSSGDVLATAGPAGAIILYIIGGFMAWLMTTCLGEMAAAMPVSGSLQAYTTEFCGPSLGFTIGWVNWVGGAATISAQIVACSILMRDIIPNSPVWMWIIIFAVLLFGANLLDAKLFGNISFWVSSIKLIMIAAFIVVGAAMVFGGFGSEGAAIARERSTGDVSLLSLCGCILTAFYAFAGTEVVASTAGELEDEKKMGRTINWTIFILIAAVVLSIVIVCMLLPADQADVLGSPFVYIFRNAGLNGAALIVNLVVLTSALTSGNYFVYGCSRYLWSMAKFNQAPKIFARTSGKGVPVNALLVSMIFGMLAIIAEFVAEDTVYLFIVYFIGGGNIFMYTVICIDQLIFRKKFLGEGGKPEDLPFKTPLYPLVPILGIIAFVLMLAATLTDPGERLGILVCAICYAVIFVGSKIFVSKRGGEAANIDL